jgi:hypothetical protein
MNNQEDGGYSSSGVDSADSIGHISYWIILQQSVVSSPGRCKHGEDTLQDKVPWKEAESLRLLSSAPAEKSRRTYDNNFYFLRAVAVRSAANFRASSQGPEAAGMDSAIEFPTRIFRP